MKEVVEHQKWMQKAIQVAQQGQYSARPNPMVGAILVEQDRMLASGCHWQAGQPHAEINALNQTTQDLKNASLYVTLEPCCHVGRTPPCIDAIIQRNIKRVVVATQDPNPKVAGLGITKLKQAGIDVEVGICQKDAQIQNIGFFSRFQRKRPYVRYKVGMSLDGKIAMHSGQSQWITSPLAREEVQAWRAKSDLVLTTHQTVNQDDCLMTVRKSFLPEEGPHEIVFKPPIRMVLDTNLKSNPQAQIFQSAQSDVWVAYGKGLATNLNRHQHHHVKSIEFPKKNGHVDFESVMQYCAEVEINQVFIEAGPKLLTELIEQQSIDELIIHLAPDLLGSKTLSMQNLLLDSLSDRIRGEFYQVKSLGRDLEIRILLSDYAKSMHQEKL